MILLVLIVLVLASLSAGEDCFFLVDGAPRQCVKVTNTSSSQTGMVTALGPCQLRLLAVGGGGRGFEYGGGGSGYLASLAQDIPPGEFLLTVDVGRSGAPSSVSAGGRVLLEAPPGHDGFYNNTNWGGDGYSGGGDGCCHPFGYP